MMNFVTLNYMKIAVDLDDILSQTMPALLKFHNENYGTNLEMKDLGKGASWETWGGTFDDDVKKIHDFHLSTYGKNILPVEGAQEVIKKLKENNELFIITARSDEIREDTKKWVEENFPNTFTEIYFTNHFLKNSTTTTKGKVCDDLSVDIFIDDALPNILSCAKPGRKVFLLDYSWNQTDKLPESVTRIKSWKELDIN